MDEVRTPQENDERRDDDRRDRDQNRVETVFVDADTGEPVRIHVVSWVNNTIWRTAVALAFAASLFSIYDNSERVKRLEGQVCQSLVQSEASLDTLQYYKDHPDEREAQRQALNENKKRFHCPNPDSPVVPAALDYLR